MSRQPHLYFDNNATAPLRPEAMNAMQTTEEMTTMSAAEPSNTYDGHGRVAGNDIEECHSGDGTEEQGHEDERKNASMSGEGFGKGSQGGITKWMNLKCPLPC